MGTSATKAKQKYNAEHYKDWRSPISIELFEEIEELRKAEGMSRSEFLTWALEKYKEIELNK